MSIWTYKNNIKNYIIHKEHSRLSISSPELQFLVLFQGNPLGPNVFSSRRVRGQAKQVCASSTKSHCLFPSSIFRILNCYYRICSVSWIWIFARISTTNKYWTKWDGSSPSSICVYYINHWFAPTWSRNCSHLWIRCARMFAERSQLMARSFFRFLRL